VVTKKKALEFSATGRRKTAVARVTITEGTGKITVNGKDANEYFETAIMRELLLKPLQVAGVEGKYDIVAVAKGGGKSGQCGAVVHGIARALSLCDESLKAVLKKNGYLSRDARMKERKKPGQPGARKRFQFSKR